MSEYVYFKQSGPRETQRKLERQLEEHTNMNGINNK